MEVIEKAINVGQVKKELRNNVSRFAMELDGDLLQRYDEKRIIEMDFIRNYGQISSSDPTDIVRNPVGARNPKEIDNFEYFKDNVGYDLKQVGRQRDDKQEMSFYPIKLLGKDGKPKEYKKHQIYLNDVPVIPVTDENDAERRSFTPLRDDYIFIIYPEVTIRGVKPFDYMRFKTPTCPPCLDTILPDDPLAKFEFPEDITTMDPVTGESERQYQRRKEFAKQKYFSQNINITRSGMPDYTPDTDPPETIPQSVMPVFHRPRYKTNGNNNTVKDEDGFPIRIDPDGIETNDYYLDEDTYDKDKRKWTFDFNWENYTFWQITRILDVPQGFQAFFTRGLSIIY